MAWITLTIDNVYDRLSQPEVNALKTAAIQKGQDVVTAVINMVVQEWRGALRRYHVVGKGSTIPSELETHILADIRYRLFTRLPGMKTLLDDLRVEEWKEARRVFRELDKFVFEDTDDPEDNTAVPNTGVELARVERRYFDRRKLKGL